MELWAHRHDRVAVRPVGSYRLLLRQPGQSQPVSAALAGELTPASPIVIAAVATRIAALRRKVIKLSPLVRCPWLVPPSERSVCRRGGIAVSPQLAHLIALQNLATPERGAEAVLSALPKNDREDRLAAEAAGFEPARGVNLNPLSRRAP